MVANAASMTRTIRNDTNMTEVVNVVSAVHTTKDNTVMIKEVNERSEDEDQGPAPAGLKANSIDTKMKPYVR